jgi:hypothetical protein
MRAKAKEGVAVWREREVRNGRRICHLFRDCRVLAGKPHDLVRWPSEGVPIPTCNGCRTGASVPGLADFA